MNDQKKERHPGEWFAEAPNPDEWEGWKIRTKNPDKTSNVISWEIARISGYDPEYDEATATLMACAPVLMEACQRLLVCMQLAGWEGDDAAEFARNAIDKATIK